MPPGTSIVASNQIGPTFHFDVDEVDFGTVSYGCPVSTTVGLTNTSEISMPWRARVPQVVTIACSAPLHKSLWNVEATLLRTRWFINLISLHVGRSLRDRASELKLNWIAATRPAWEHFVCKCPDLQSRQNCRQTLLTRCRLSLQESTFVSAKPPIVISPPSFVNQDGAFRKKEITITPSSGNLSPGQRVDLLVELMSQTVKVSATEDYFVGRGRFLLNRVGI